MLKGVALLELSPTCCRCRLAESNIMFGRRE